MKRLCADGILWHGTGRTPWAGDHEGIDAVLDHLGRVGEAADVFDADLGDLLVSEERAATVMQVSARRGDRRLEVPFLILYWISQGRIAEVWSAPLDHGFELTLAGALIGGAGLQSLLCRRPTPPGGGLSWGLGLTFALLWSNVPMALSRSP